MRSEGKKSAVEHAKQQTIVRADINANLARQAEDFCKERMAERQKFADELRRLTGPGW
jgi:hypothetical protein